MEEKKSLLLKERERLVSVGSNSEGGDDLDAYMSGLSSQLVVDKTVKIEKELSDLQTELDRTTYLLKIADPRGDAARKRETKAEMPKPNQPVLDLRKQPQPKQKKPLRDEKPISSSTVQETSSSAQGEKPASSGQVKDACENNEKKPTVYTVTKPQWLGDAKDMKLEDDHVREAIVEVAEPDSFVDYKDRKKVLASVNNAAELENAAPGLIIRKRKPIEEPDESVDKVPRVSASSSAESETTAADAVALLLKHKRGYIALDEDVENESQQCRVAAPGKATSQPKRVLGPSKPDFLDRGPDYEAWVPPEGQTGDGRTSLNDRLGY